MASQRDLKKLKTKTWFRPSRGGTKVSLGKDYPKPYQQRQPGDNPRKWRVKQPTPAPTRTQKDPGGGTRVKVLESPVFIPFTWDSMLRKALQKVDDILGECMNSPGVKFVERCGGQTIGELLGSSNPWARSLRCGRQGCIQCKGRDLLLMEEEQRPIPGPGQPAVPRPSREDLVALPKCTS